MVVKLAPHSLPWRAPLDLAAQLNIGDASWVLLYSGLPGHKGQQRSYLAHMPQETVRAEDFAALEKMLSGDRLLWDNAWFGYLGYGLKDCLERLPADLPGELRMPALWMSRYRRIFCFDHATKELTLWADATPEDLPHTASAPADTDVAVTALRSNMTKTEYLDIVRQTIERIHAGDFYQANITRKFSGTLEHAPDPLALFAALARISPAPMSALLKCGDTYVLSSSPESFLSVDAQGHAITRPIKGSAKRSPDATEDAALRSALAASAKDRAENLMIVDLMRNDLAKTCTEGSVETSRLFDIESFASVHHMVSTVRGTKRPGISTLDLVKGCFPPGSMTGAPKIPAMAWCTEKEKIARGVYSGAIGFFGGDGSAELSVVIRTLLLKGNSFEFQAGGGIVADSEPEAEWQETIVKAKGIASLLHIGTAELERL